MWKLIIDINNLILLFFRVYDRYNYRCGVVIFSKKFIEIVYEFFIILNN